MKDTKITYKIKTGPKVNQKKITYNSCIFLYNNDCETPYVDTFIDLQSITFIYCPCFCMVY